MDRSMVKCDRELVYMRFRSLHESDLMGSGIGYVSGYYGFSSSVHISG